MPGEHKTQILVAVIGLAGALGGGLLANWDKIFPTQALQTQVLPTVSVTTPTPKPIPTPTVPSTPPKPIAPNNSTIQQNNNPTFNIAGLWTDQNGIGYEIYQDNPENFDIIITDSNTTTYGSGTISKQNITFEYENQNGSTGFGTGIISANATQMQINVNDTGSGKFQIVLRKQ